MPTYDYECAACGHKFEMFQSIKEDPIKACPKCKRRKARRLIGTGAGLLFKGSGFYITDYRSEGYKKAQKAETSSSSSSGGESGSKKAEATPKAERAKKGD
jgi:putative FmdB family regulatory protein